MYYYDKYNIECLNDFHLGKNEYFYKSHSFLFDNSNESRNLIVSFHGAINRDTQLPVYRFYDYKFQNSDCLCCFDQNLSTYKKEQLLLSWFLIDSDEDIYKEIINHILQKKAYEKVIFVGSSGGGYYGGSGAGHTPASQGNSGSGGGGCGGYYTSPTVPGGNGTANTGGGSGGNGTPYAGTGGSGIVMIRYKFQ